MALPPTMLKIQKIHDQFLKKAREAQKKKADSKKGKTPSSHPKTVAGPPAISKSNRKSKSTSKPKHVDIEKLIYEATTPEAIKLMHKKNKKRVSNASSEPKKNQNVSNNSNKDASLAAGAAAAIAASKINEKKKSHVKTVTAGAQTSPVTPKKKKKDNDLIGGFLRWGDEALGGIDEAVTGGATYIGEKVQWGVTHPVESAQFIGKEITENPVAYGVAAGGIIAAPFTSGLSLAATAAAAPMIAESGLEEDREYKQAEKAFQQAKQLIINKYGLKTKTAKQRIALAKQLANAGAPQMVINKLGQNLEMYDMEEVKKYANSLTLQNEIRRAEAQVSKKIAESGDIVRQAGDFFLPDITKKEDVKKQLRKNLKKKGFSQKHIKEILEGYDLRATGTGATNIASYVVPEVGAEVVGSKILGKIAGKHAVRTTAKYFGKKVGSETAEQIIKTAGRKAGHKTGKEFVETVIKETAKKTGRTLPKKTLNKLTKSTMTRSTALSTGLAGIYEGAGSAAIFDVAHGQGNLAERINPKHVAAGGLIGFGTAGLFGAGMGHYAAKASKKGSRGVLGLAYLTDFPYEPVGDVIGGAIKRKAKVNVVNPSAVLSGSPTEQTTTKPTEQQILDNVLTQIQSNTPANTNTPTNTNVPTSTPTSTPSNTPSSVPTNTPAPSNIPGPATQRGPSNTPENTPENTPTSDITNVPQNAPVPTPKMITPPVLPPMFQSGPSAPSKGARKGSKIYYDETAAAKNVMQSIM